MQLFKKFFQTQSLHVFTKLPPGKGRMMLQLTEAETNFSTTSQTTQKMIEIYFVKLQMTEAKKHFFVFLIRQNYFLLKFECLSSKWRLKAMKFFRHNHKQYIKFLYPVRQISIIPFTQLYARNVYARNKYLFIYKKIWHKVSFSF